MNMVATHLFQPPAGDDGGVESVIRPVYDDGGDVVSFQSDWGEKGRGVDGDAVPLVGADEPVGGGG